MALAPTVTCSPTVTFILFLTGAYGEASPEVHDMLQRISEAWAARYYVEMGYDDELQARSLCLTRARRRLATMAILNSAWLVHDRINDFETGDGLRRHRR